MTSGSSNRQVLSVYLNLLDGSLLVDGKAQGTLPKEIIQHSFFKTLFPNRVRCQNHLHIVLIFIDAQLLDRRIPWILFHQR
jgi:hypothetical protein